MTKQVKWKDEYGYGLVQIIGYADQYDRSSINHFDIELDDNKTVKQQIHYPWFYELIKQVVPYEKINIHKYTKMLLFLEACYIDGIVTDSDIPLLQSQLKIALKLREQATYGEKDIFVLIRKKGRLVLRIKTKFLDDIKQRYTYVVDCD